MRIDSAYTLAARDDLASAIDHFMLRKLPEHARKAVLDLARGTEFLLREKRLLLEAAGDVRHLERADLLAAIEAEGVRPPKRALRKLKWMRNDAEHDGACPRLAELEEVAESVFRFIWRFMQAELGFAPGEGFDNQHAAVLRAQPLTLCGKAKLFAAAAMGHVHEEPQYGVEFADRAVDCIVRDLAQSCGLEQERMTFAEIADALMEVGNDCAPWYVVGEDPFTELRYVTPDFFDHGPMDQHAAEEHVVLARQVVNHTLEHLHRPEWEAAIRRRWTEVLGVLEHDAPHSYGLVPQPLADESSLDVVGDIIRIRPLDSAHRGDRALAADIEDAIRQVVTDLPPEFRVVVGWALWIGGESV